MKLIVDRGKNGLQTKEFVEYLKTPILKTELTASEADELRTQLEEGMLLYPGLGISAPQLGIKKRACYIKFGEEDLFLVNPIIISKSQEGFLFFEGCLSIPSERYFKTESQKSLIFGNSFLNHSRSRLTSTILMTKLSSLLPGTNSIK